MPLFFIVAGFLSNKEYSIKKFYFSKIKRLLVPYIFINIIDYIPRHLFPEMVNNAQNSFIRIIFYSGVTTWFIYTLFLLLLIFPILEKYIFKKDKYYIFFISLIIINIIFSREIENIKIFTLGRIIFYLVYFYFGYILKHIYSKLINTVIFKSKKLNVLLIIYFLFFNYKYTDNIYTLILYPYLGFILALKLSLYLKKIKKLKFIEFCGENSLVFYLLEPFFSVPYRIGLVKLLGLQNHLIIVILFFILKFISLYIATVMINKISIVSILFGNKNLKKK